MEKRKKKDGIRITIEDRHMKLNKRLGEYTKNEREFLLGYFESIKKGIERAARDIDPVSLDGLESYKESFTYELAEKFREEIMRDKPPKKRIEVRARKLAFKRKKSWFDSMLRQKESIQLNAKPCYVTFCETGSFLDVGFPSSEDWPIFTTLSNPYEMNPEQCICYDQVIKMVRALPNIVGSLKRKRASEYEAVLKIQLSGEDVLPPHRDLIGAKSDEELKGWKFQAFTLAGRVMAEIFPELEEKQALYRKQRGKKYKIRKSTFQDRKKLFRKYGSKETEPGPITVWKMIEGKKVLVDIIREPRPSKGHVSKRIGPH
jgi:hypothetical protein